MHLAVVHLTRLLALTACPRPRSGRPAAELAAPPDLALLAVPQEDPEPAAATTTGLQRSLELAGLELRLAPLGPGDSVTYALRRAAGDGNVRAVFELHFSGMSAEIVEASEELHADLYRWQPAVSMFKRVLGSFGPVWLASGETAGASEDIVTEARGWGYLQGDEEPVVQTSELSDDEIGTLLGLPATAPSGGSSPGDGADAPRPAISELGYSTRCEAVEAADDALGTMARQVLRSKATEPPGAYRLADGSAWPDEGVEGVFLSPLSGAPLFSGGQRRVSTTGWPSFSASDARGDAAEPAALAQHLSTAADVSGGAVRLELVESATAAHLGHDMGGGVLCVNAAALLFVRRGDPPPASLPEPAAPAVAAALRSRPELLGAVRCATLAGGCFWSLRSRLAELPGVVAAVAGFTGGTSASPTYEEVCSGSGGHVEAVQLAFAPSALAYSELLDAFWTLHDPTTALRQGADVGPQYAPAVFWHSQAQRDAAEASRASVQGGLPEGVAVATRVEPAAIFWPAGDEHQR